MSVGYIAQYCTNPSFLKGKCMSVSVLRYFLKYAVFDKYSKPVSLVPHKFPYLYQASHVLKLESVSPMMFSVMAMMTVVTRVMSTFVVSISLFFISVVSMCIFHTLFTVLLPIHIRLHPPSSFLHCQMLIS